MFVYDIQYWSATEKRRTDEAVSDRLFETGSPMAKHKQELYGS